MSMLKWTSVCAAVSLAATCLSPAALDAQRAQGQAAPQTAAQAPAMAPARVVPIQITGDAAARFSMVVMGDGYTAAEMPRYRAHLDKHLNVLWSIEPFRSYRNYINVYSIEIESPESGITCDPEVRQPRNTPLGLQFGGGCTNPNARGITPAQGRQEIVRKYAAMATPQFDQILILANTDTYGGIGGALATTSGGNSLGPLITPHELGHSLGRLGDEYTYSARGVAGGAYTGNEPNAVHMTLMSIEDMLTKQAKWFRWLGVESESGGKIGRYEGGSSRTTGVWRPSKHSMMISVGYYFDQVSRERMVQRISEQVKLIADSTPEDLVLSPKTDVIWIDTPQPTYHELTVTWTTTGPTGTAGPAGATGPAGPTGPTGPAGAGAMAAAPRNERHFSLSDHKVAPGSTVTVTVVDPTPFVRDPEIRSKVLTATRSWKVGSDPGVLEKVTAAFGNSTQTARPIGRGDVVAVTTANPRDRIMNVTWTLNGQPVRDASGSRVLALGPRKLPAGTHRLTAQVTDPAGPNLGGETRAWTIDATDPTVIAAIATPVATIAGVEPHYFLRDEFTMQLDPKDDQPGYVVAEFRVNGDGWHHYYGWPDAPPGTPYTFTPRGTTIKELVYGSLSSEGLSPQPWEPREPGWGHHRIEYRGIDAAGNIGAAKAFRVTFEESVACGQSITGRHEGNLQVASGVTCLAPGATVVGAVTVSAGASLVATAARITGGVTATGAAVIELAGATVDGPIRLTGTTGRVTVFGISAGGDLTITDSRTLRAPVVAGGRITGALACTGNTVAPTDGGTAPSARTRTGQCAIPGAPGL